MKKSIYSKPKVCKSKDGWYVWFRYDGKLRRYKFGLNYIKDLVDREKEANALCRAVAIKLKQGWNPLVPDLPEFGDEMLLTYSLEFALEEKRKNLKPKSYSCYKSSLKFIQAAIKELNLDLLLVKETKRSHIRSILQKAKTKYKWTNKSYNKHLNHLKAIMSELIEWDIIENNPAHKIKNLPVNQVEANITATPDQHKIIKKHLSENHYNFYVFVISIFHTGIRPWELLQIKIENIKFDNFEIRLPAEITKTKKERVVPVNSHLMHHLINIGAHDVPSDYYLFGSFRKPGAGNVGPKKDFIPGPTRLSRDTATKRWKTIVKDGLGIDVNLYSNKHAGADAKIIAGIDLSALQELYGHSSKFMTMKYAKKVTEVYRNEIINKSPEY